MIGETHASLASTTPIQAKFGSTTLAINTWSKGTKKKNRGVVEPRFILRVSTFFLRRFDLLFRAGVVFNFEFFSLPSETPYNNITSFSSF